jgi:hypothetical protein
MRRGVPVLAVALVLTGSAAAAPAPPIKVVNLAPSRAVKTALAIQLGLATTPGKSTSSCVTWTKGHPAKPCSAAQQAKLDAQATAHQAMLRCGPFSPPRVVAELPLLGSAGQAQLVAWRTNSGRLCFELAEPHGTSAAFGPCDAACGPICLASNGSGPNARLLTYVLGGSVSSRGTAVRVVESGGRVATYPLRGPLVPGPSSRIFMLELGSRDWRRIDLLRGAAVIAGKSKP